MKKRLITFTAALLFVTAVSAVPAKRTKTQVRQPDGTVLTVMVAGDENFHFTCTEDHQPVVRRSDGTYCYARLSADGGIVPTSQMAHNVAERTEAEQTFLSSYEAEAVKLRSIGSSRRAERNARRLSRRMNRTAAVAGLMKSEMAGATGGEGIGVTGKRKGLVILVNFKDKAMLAKNSQAEWDKFFNQEGYTVNGNFGSVRDYFKAQSYGQFDLEFDVVGPVTVSKNMAAYGKNDSKGNDVDPGGMIYEACQLVDSQVNFADYDWDGDGEVDQVFVVYAGYGEASGTDENPIANTIWQHEWSLSAQNYQLRLDGVTIDTYACSSELNGNTGSTTDGIGTACHEFSHCLGLPDMYDTEYSGCFGMGSWDVMDYGSYGDDGYKPVGYNTYERWVSGWLQPTVLSEPCSVDGMKALSDSPESYVVFNEKTPTEYYIFENRQRKGVDTELPASGMLVIHVDYDKDAWEEDVVNNVASHQRFTIVPADNKLTSKTETGDTYPGTSGNTSLTDTSQPAAKLFNANADGRYLLGKPVTDIKESNGLISFTFDGGVKIGTPVTNAASDITATSFTANWAPVDGAESYNLELRQKSGTATPDEAVRVTESFANWGVGLKADGTQDVSGKLDELMANSGWTGTKVYECPGMAKLGSSKAKGNLVSPLVSDHSSAAVTVRLLSKKYGNDVATVDVSLVDADDRQIASATVSPDDNVQTVVLDNAAELDYKVKIAPSKRCYVKGVGIYDGDFAEADFDDASAVSMSLPAFATPARSAQQFNGIAATSYIFEGLEASSVYQWRVQAMSNGVVSAWSAWQTVELGGADCIKSVFSEMPSTASVDVYTVSGATVGRMRFSDFLRVPLASGVYIIKYGNTTVHVLK